MTKQEFNGTLRSYGFKPDGEYDGVWKHPDAPVYIYLTTTEVDQLAISWDMEYTVYRTLTEKRLIAILEAFEK